MKPTTWPEFAGASIFDSPAGSVSRASGVADRNAGLRWTYATQSQLASISKQFAAACALILVNRGVLRLDDPIGQHLAGADPEWDSVRVLDLLTHTSGMSHWSQEPGYASIFAGSTEQRVRLILARPPSHLRGEFRYSSPGYLLLSAVLATAAGRPYTQLVTQLVIEPLRLTDTTMGVAGPGPVAAGYRSGGAVDGWDPRTMPGTGDVWSTAPDLARLIRALHVGDFLPGDVQPLLHNIAIPCVSWSNGPRVHVHSYAAGHFMGTIDGTPACLIPGDNPGFQSLGVWLPQSSTSIVVLANDDTADVEAETLEILSAAAHDE